MAIVRYWQRAPDRLWYGNAGTFDEPCPRAAIALTWEPVRRSNDSAASMREKVIDAYRAAAVAG